MSLHGQVLGGFALCIWTPQLLSWPLSKTQGHRRQLTTPGQLAVNSALSEHGGFVPFSEPPADQQTSLAILGVGPFPYIQPEREGLRQVVYL